MNGINGILKTHKPVEEIMNLSRTEILLGLDGDNSPGETINCTELCAKCVEGKIPMGFG
jgi:hypothetical protein